MAAAKPIGVAFAAIAIVAVGAIAVEGLHSKQQTVAITTTSTGSALSPSAQTTPTALVIPTISATPSTPATSHKPSVAPSTAAARTSSAAPRTSTAAAAGSSTAASASSNSESAAQQVLDVINKARAQNGLKPYTMSSDLIKSASAHNARMEENGCGLSHQCSGEAALGDRESAAGVQWTSAGENIGEGGPVSNTQPSIADMAVSLTNSMLAEQPPDDGHRLNILSSSFTEVGIAVTRDSSGTVWMTQDFSGDG